MQKLLSFTALAVMLASLMATCRQPSLTDATNAPLSKDSLIKRGQYLVTIMGCHDCHSPKIVTPQGPIPDTNLLLSGHPASMPVAFIDTTSLKNWVLFNGYNTASAGPWGVSFAANLSADITTGIGSWTEAQFAKALREGRSKGLEGNRMLLPPMPWTSFIHLSDADLKAMFAYLKSTKPIRNLVPAPLPPGQINKKS